MTFEFSNNAKFGMTSSSKPPIALDDRVASIHWEQSKNAARGSLFSVFVDGVRIAECWNTATADLPVPASRQLSDCQRREGKDQPNFFRRFKIEDRARFCAGVCSFGLGQSASEMNAGLADLSNTYQNTLSSWRFSPKTKVIGERVQMNLALGLCEDTAVTKHQWHQQSPMRQAITTDNSTTLPSLAEQL